MSYFWIPDTITSQPYSCRIMITSNWGSLDWHEMWYKGTFCQLAVLVFWSLAVLSGRPFLHWGGHHGLAISSQSLEDRCLHKMTLGVQSKLMSSTFNESQGRSIPSIILYADPCNIFSRQDECDSWWPFQTQPMTPFGIVHKKPVCPEILSVVWTT